MSDELRDIIAAPIRECFGVESPHEWVAMRILAALKASGYEVVKLPEPQQNWDGSLTAWPVVQHWNGQEVSDGEVSIRLSDKRITATCVSNPCDCPDDARSLAAGLLAAAIAIDAANAADTAYGA